MTQGESLDSQTASFQRTDRLRYSMKSPVLLGLFALFLPNCKTQSPDDGVSEVLQETDDRELDRTKELKDSDEVFESFVNGVLAEERQKIGITTEVSPADRDRFVDAVYQRLGANHPGTGIKIGIGPLSQEISQLTHVEHWFAETLSPENQTIAFIKFSESWYKENPIGLLKGRAWSHVTKSTADHSIAPVMRLRGTLMGSDKWGHFFQQGYWYYRSGLPRKDRWNLGLFLEGDPTVEKFGTKFRAVIAEQCRSCAKFGYFGSFSTGVISYADCYANEFGWRFYTELAENPAGYRFSLANFDVRYLNESHIRSQTANSVEQDP